MSFINFLQIVVALALVVVIILQNRGDSGMGLGGGSTSYRSKKGLEKFLFYATIFLAAVFAALSILSVLI